MAKFKCPGQDMRFWKPKDVFEAPCPHCDAVMEFWKDDPFLRCTSCGRKVRNPKIDLGCAKWCKYAEQCLGYVPQVDEAEDSICDHLIAAMKDVFRDDERRIKYAIQVLEYAEDILSAEEGNPLVVKAAAILHDIGIPEAERKHGSSAGRYQEIEGPPVARFIMEDLGLDDAVVDHVCRIVGSHHSAKDTDTPEFRIVWDADWLVNMAEEWAGKDLHELAALIERTFRTPTGRAIAEKRIQRNALHEGKKT